jgi:hypothetical protein
MATLMPCSECGMNKLVIPGEHHCVKCNPAVYDRLMSEFLKKLDPDLRKDFERLLNLRSFIKLEQRF